MLTKSILDRPAHSCFLLRFLTTTSTTNPFQLTHLLPPQLEEEKEDEGGGDSISNRSYWSSRIHALCSDDDPDEALRLLDRLRLRGYSPNPVDIAAVVRALCSAGRSDEAHTRVLLLLLLSSSVYDEHNFNALLSLLLDARTPLLTLRLLRRLPCCSSFVPSVSNYNRLIHLLCSLPHPPLAVLHAHRLLLLDMPSKGRHPNAASYTALLAGYARLGESRAARQLLDEMSQNNVAPNSLTRSVLIKAVLRNRDVEECKRLMRQFWPAMELEHDEDPFVKSAAFANLIDCLCHEGMFHEVFRIAEEMPQGKSVDEEFAYGQMMDSLCRAGRHHGASRIVYIMRKRSFVPSLVSYNCIIHGLSKGRGCMRAYQLLKEGLKFGYSLPEPTYKVLVEGLCRERDLNKAKDVLELMLSQKDNNDEVEDRTRIYNIFLSALRVVDNPSEQLNVLVSMLQKQCRPDVITLNTVIHGFCKIGRVAEAKKIMNDMLKGTFCAPDVVTFTTIICGLLDVGETEEAIEILRGTMLKHHCLPNVVTFNAVLKGLFKLQKFDKAMEIFEDMNVAADSATHAVVIEGLCEAGRMEEAKRFWDEVVWPSKMHDDYVYAAIFGGLCRLGKLDQACDFLYELIDCGVSPGIICYNILINSACKLGLKKQAYWIVREMRKNGLNPDAVTWRILENLHEKDRREHASNEQSSESSVTLEKKVELEDDIPDAVTWRILDNLHEKDQREHVGNDQSSESSLILEKVELKDDISISTYEGKEYDTETGSHGDLLEGLIDPSISSLPIDEDVKDVGHRVRSRINLTGNFKERHWHKEEREPLSRIARRVFGLYQLCQEHC
ncbi:uncharacterized protein [Typha angustifolia]|uniref:uncharacterized protein n=1 Tax=Typha angustifolia TaxID=59011 RepID=UPI003C2B01D4